MPRGQQYLPHLPLKSNFSYLVILHLYLCTFVSNYQISFQTNGFDIGSVLFGNVQPLFQMATILVLETSPGHQPMNH